MIKNPSAGLITRGLGRPATAALTSIRFGLFTVTIERPRLPPSSGGGNYTVPVVPVRGPAFYVPANRTYDHTKQVIKVTFSGLGRSHSVVFSPIVSIADVTIQLRSIATASSINIAHIKARLVSIKDRVKARLLSKGVD